MTPRFEKLSHSLYECKYHIVFCPKYRMRVLKEEIAEYTRQQIYQLCRQKDRVKVLELTIQPDHVHLVCSAFRRSTPCRTSERQTGLALVQSIRVSRQAILGATSVDTRLLCKHHWVGRRENPQVCEMARET